MAGLIMTDLSAALGSGFEVLQTPASYFIQIFRDAIFVDNPL